MGPVEGSFKVVNVAYVELHERNFGQLRYGNQELDGHDSRVGDAQRDLGRRLQRLERVLDEVDLVSELLQLLGVEDLDVLRVAWYVDVRFAYDAERADAHELLVGRHDDLDDVVAGVDLRERLFETLGLERERKRDAAPQNRA